MQPLQQWAFGKIVLVSMAWFVSTFVVLVFWLIARSTVWADVSSGSGGIGAVSIEINGAMLAIPVVPPVALIVAWWAAHRRSPQ